MHTYIHTYTLHTYTHTHTHTHAYMYKHTDRHTDRQTYKHMHLATYVIKPSIIIIKEMFSGKKTHAQTQSQHSQSQGEEVIGLLDSSCGRVATPGWAFAASYSFIRLTKSRHLCGRCQGVSSRFAITVSVGKITRFGQGSVH